MPAAATFEKWASDRTNSFQFSFKFPKRITHAPDDAFAPELARWMHRLIGEEVLKIDPQKAWLTLPTLENSGLSKPTQMSLF